MAEWKPLSFQSSWFFNSIFVLTALILTGCLLIFSRIMIENLADSNFVDEKIHIPKILIEFIFMFDSKIFLIEPGLLAEFSNPKQIEQLRWRFNMDKLQFKESDQFVTFGLFDYNQNEFYKMLKMENITYEKFECLYPFDSNNSNNNNNNVTGHIIFQLNGWTIHTVIFYHVEHFLWIGQLSSNHSTIINDHQQQPLRFGKYEQIFEPFRIEFYEIIPIPDDHEYFLSQLSTSRYLHCSMEKMNWFKQHKIPLNEERIRFTIDAIITMKSFMKELQMQFWIMCGTLLGWYRHCHPIPYTTDTDLSTWSKYFQNEQQDIENMTETLKYLAPKHGLNLFYRFGEPTKTLEYSFRTQYYDEKIDLFITYIDHINGSYFLPSHITRKKQYRNYYYPRYDLCSIQLLGHKLLAPCQTEKVIEKEYGPDWNIPIEEWNYASSPFNGGELKNFSFPINQYTEYSRLYKPYELIRID